MGEEKSLLTRIGYAVEAARDKAQEMNASLVKKAEGAAPLLPRSRVVFDIEQTVPDANA